MMAFGTEDIEEEEKEGPTAIKRDIITVHDDPYGATHHCVSRAMDIKAARVAARAACGDRID